MTVTDAERQAIVDGEHLRFLAIAYWVTGGVTAFIALYGLVYVAMGVMIAVTPNNDWVTEPGQAAPPDLFGWFLAGIGAAIVLLCAIVAALQVLTGFWIRKRRRRFCVWSSLASRAGASRTARCSACSPSSFSVAPRSGSASPRRAPARQQRRRARPSSRRQLRFRRTLWLRLLL